MHSDTTQMRKNLHANVLRQAISQKIDTAKKATIQQLNIDYCDFIYLVVEGRIKRNVIKAFLKEIHDSNLEQINNNWKQKMSNEKILKDIYEIKKKAVQKQWTEMNIDESNVKMKEERYNEFGCKLKTRKQLNYRIKQLSDQIKIVENNINMSKSQSGQLKLRQQYKLLTTEFKFLTNKQRKLRNLSEQKMINDSLSKSKQKLNQIHQKIEKQFTQQKRLRQVQNFKFNVQTKSSQVSPRKQKDRLKKLQDIFVQYSKKQAKQLMLFDQMMRTHKYMSLENYLRFIMRSGIGVLLSLDERVSIFKSVSQYAPKVSFLDFMEILKEICMKQCQKLNVRFKTAILDTFLEEMITHLQTSQHKFPAIPLLQNSNDFMKDLRGQIPSNYKFKVKGHTGKQKNQIEQFIKQKKKSNKTQPTLNQSSKIPQIHLAKISTNSEQMSRNSDRISIDRDKIIKRKYTHNYKTVMINQDTPQTASFKSSMGGKDSYSSIFLRKRTVLKKAQQKQQQNKYIVESVDLSETKNEITNNIPYIYQEEYKQLSQSRQLGDIIQLNEDDPFLTSHFAHKYSLGSNKPPYQNTKYHF